VAFVPLDDVSEGGGVLPAIRELLAIPGSGPAFEAIVRHVDGRDVLLVLDNFEHVLDAAADISGLLERCARLTALVTTRVVLRVRGEHDLTLRPLDPDDAVELFLTRAHAQSADFPLDSRHHDLVAEICERLEGLPLAVEIAVAQLRVLSPAALLEGLHRVSSTRAGPAYPRRQQTVRATIAWSVDLLDADTRRAFARTSVFHGGFTLTAFEDVCASGRDAQALLASLVESSLVVREPDQAEYRLTTLNVVREYAEGLLAGAGATAETRDRHANHYLGLVEDLSTSLRSGDHRTSMARLDRELYNIRSALDWTVDRGDGNAVAAAAWALMPYWAFRELSEEGRGWMEDIVERGALLPAARARALAINGFLRLWRGDYAGAAAVSAQALQETRMLSDEYGAAHAEMVLGILQCIGGDATVGLELLEHARASFDRVGDEWGVSMALIGIVWGMNAAGTDSGIELYEDTLARAAQLGFEAETLALGALGRRHALRGEHDVARRQLVDALRRVQAIDARLGIALYVDLIADVAAAQNEGRIAARLGAAATVIAQEVGAPVPGIAGDRTKRLELLGRRLGTSGLEEESEAGRMLSADQAARDAIAWAEEQAPP
jgi:predicted ATPase